MDFWQLLGLAEDKQKEKSSVDGKFLSTKIAPPQKDPKQKKLSENVKKFMQSKSSEQIAKEKEAEEKRKKLLQLRSENKKSQRTMKAMLNMTKSADKSAVSDAKHSAHITTGSRQQCDEDDYGYESNAARAFFEKIMTKYEESPEDPMDKFTKSGRKKKVVDLQETKNRVREKLNEEPEKHSKSRERRKDDGPEKSHEVSSNKISGGKDERRREEDPKKKKPSSSSKNHHPPPPSFADLIRMAEEAKTKPVETKQKAGKEYEFDRPMTSKEKEEYFREQQSKARKSGKALAAKDQAAAKSGKPGPASSKTKPDGGTDSGKQKETKPVDQKNSILREVLDGKGPSKESGSKPVPEFKKPPPTSSKPIAEVKKPEKPPVPKITGPEFHPAVVKPPPKPILKPQPSGSSKNGLSNSKPSLAKSSGSMSKKFPDKDSSKLPSKKPLSKPSSSRRSRSRSSSPEIRRGSKRPPSRSPSPEFRRKTASKQTKNRNRIDSESEQDSEMDDFIDDTEATFDISAEIRSIFGYDRKKYRYEEDFDDRSMETNRFADVMKEEARSARIGRMEDLEDMRREEEEKKRKMMKKKKR